MIYLDDRTGSRELHAAILSLDRRDAVSSIMRLDYADAFFVGNGPKGNVSIGVERKSVTDLVNSINEGRLVGHQLPGMLDTYDHSCLIVEGGWRRNPRTGGIDLYRDPEPRPRAGGSTPGGSWYPAPFRMTWDQLQGYLHSLAVIVRFPHYRTRNLAETAALIATMYSWRQKPWGNHSAHLQFHRQQVEHVRLVKAPLLVRVAKEFPGIGWQRDWECDRLYKSVVEMVNQTPDQWAAAGIQGVSQGRGAQIAKALHGDREALDSIKDKDS